MSVFSNYVNRYSDMMYLGWIIDKSGGLMRNALPLISESVREYCYLLIVSQVGTKRNIYHPDARQSYLQKLL